MNSPTTKSNCPFQKNIINNIINCADYLGFFYYQVTPVTKFPEEEINEASQRLLSRHQFPQRVIHMQVK